MCVKHHLYPFDRQWYIGVFVFLPCIILKLISVPQFQCEVRQWAFGLRRLPNYHAHHSFDVDSANLCRLFTFCLAKHSTKAIKHLQGRLQLWRASSVKNWVLPLPSTRCCLFNLPYREIQSESRKRKTGAFYIQAYSSHSCSIITNRIAGLCKWWADLRSDSYNCIHDNGAPRLL